jgi:cytidine deaminase
VSSEPTSDPATQGVLSAALVQELCDRHRLTPARIARALVPFAQALAQPVISGFEVGVVARGTSGAMYYGANLEFPGEALLFTVHAEQSATTNAWNNGEQGLELLAVSAAPCGYCRQFLWETAGAANIQVYVAGNDPTTVSPGLLPAPFGPNDLKVKAALMAPQAVALQLDVPDGDPVVLAALQAAQFSYAPYTESYAGVAVVGGDGVTYTGRVAENAAFNPSMSPLASAMAMVTLARQRDHDVRRIALVELTDPVTSQVAPTKAVARALGVATVDVHTAHLV